MIFRIFSCFVAILTSMFKPTLFNGGCSSRLRVFVGLAGFSTSLLVHRYICTYVCRMVERGEKPEQEYTYGRKRLTERNHQREKQLSTDRSEVRTIRLLLP